MTRSARPRNAKLRVEEIEQRVVPATPLPAATVTETQTILDQNAFGNTLVGSTGFAAQAAIDPTNPQRMVVVRSTGARPATGGEAIYGEFTLDVDPFNML